MITCGTNFARKTKKKNFLKTKSFRPVLSLLKKQPKSFQRISEFFCVSEKNQPIVFFHTYKAIVYKQMMRKSLVREMKRRRIVHF